MSNMKNMYVKYEAKFKKAGIPVSDSLTMNKCLEHFIKKRKTRVTSVFNTLNYVLNIESAEAMKRAGVMVFGEKFLELELDEIENYMKLASLEVVPSHSISKEDIDNLEYMYIALGDLITSLKVEGTSEDVFNDALARFYMGVAKISKG